MNSKRAKALIKFVESLKIEERWLVRTLVQPETAKETISEMKQKDKKKMKRKRKIKHSRYSDDQIRKAMELRVQNVKDKEIARITKIKQGNLRNSKWLKERFDKLMKMIPADEKKRTW